MTSDSEDEDGLWGIYRAAEASEWGGPTRIDSAGLVGSPSLLLAHSNGNFHALWREREAVLSNRYAAEVNGWATPANEEGLQGPGGEQVYWPPTQTIDGNGDILAILREFRDAQGEPPIQARYWWTRRTSSGWSTAQLFWTLGEGEVIPSEGRLLRGNDRGDAVATWAQRVSTGARSIRAKRFSADSGVWSAPVLLDTEDADASWLDAAMDPAGNAIVVWTQHDGVQQNLWWARFSVDSGSWQPALRVLTDGGDDVEGDPSESRLAIDAAGNAVMLFRLMKPGSTPTYELRATRLAAGANGWDDMVILETSMEVSQQHLTISMDDAGSAVALWLREREGLLDLWASVLR
jgi:hypothetical protein